MRKKKAIFESYLDLDAPKGFIRVTNLARQFGTQTYFWYTSIIRGRIGCVRVGRSVYIRLTDAEKHMHKLGYEKTMDGTYVRRPKL